MIRQIIPFLVAIFLFTGITAQNTSLPEKTGGFSLSLETGQANTKWPVTSLIKTDVEDFAEVDWLQTASRPTRISLLYNKGKFSGGLGLQHERNTVLLYQPTAGYSDRTHHRFTKTAVFAQMEYRFAKLSAWDLGVSLRYGQYLGAGDEYTLMKGNSMLEIGLPLQFNFNKNIGFIFQPFYGRQKMSTTLESGTSYNMSQYGITLGLKVNF